MRRSTSPAMALTLWSAAHPVGISMMMLAVWVLGWFALKQLGINLLPHLIYPEIRVRVTDAGVPASVMEEKVTRLLEEQLGVTENAISVESETTEGRSTVNLGFPYGTDIDLALRDASTRLDRAKRFLPRDIDPPTIYKRDPAQTAVLELVVHSPQRSLADTSEWVREQLSPWLVGLTGVAAVEIGGDVVREIQIFPDLLRLYAMGLRIDQLAYAIEQENQDHGLGLLHSDPASLPVRLVGRWQTVEELKQLPIRLPVKTTQSVVYLADVANIIDHHSVPQVNVRFNGIQGINLAIQKQPTANTVAVVERVLHQLAWLKQKNMIPADIQVNPVKNQATYVHHAVNNAQWAMFSGAALAMLMVYLFLGHWLPTLIIGVALPLALALTFILMAAADLSLNIMTLGGLALGMGMLVDSGIVMLENITRQIQQGHSQPIKRAAAEVNNAITASTATNLAAILPFLFISGLVGLLFRELIFTLAAASLAAWLVAMTLTPALAKQMPAQTQRPQPVMNGLRTAYVGLLAQTLKRPWWVVLVFVLGLSQTAPLFWQQKQDFLPNMDEGVVEVRLRGTVGMPLTEMDNAVRSIEALLRQQPEVASVYSVVGGSLFGRSQSQASHRSSLTVQLHPQAVRAVTAQAWMDKMKKTLRTLDWVGIEARLSVQGIRGIRLSRGDDDFSLRIQGKDRAVLTDLAEQFVDKLNQVNGLRNVHHSNEDNHAELQIVVNRWQANALGLSLDAIHRQLKPLLRPEQVGDVLEHGRSVPIKLQALPSSLSSAQDLAQLWLQNNRNEWVRLGDVAQIEWLAAPVAILRDKQQRYVEVSASLVEGVALKQVLDEAQRVLQGIVPPSYVYYDAGISETLRQGQNTHQMLIALALFLVFAVMAIQYESLRDPLVILFSIPFSLIGVALGIRFLDLTLTMPVWLGVIMLIGMVVNNSLVLVDTIKQQTLPRRVAILTAAGLRLRPILMTTLSTLIGLTPLALGWGEGTEMLQPLAITLIWGLGFSLSVSLLLIPAVYLILTPQSPSSS